ncbi:putative ORFan [Cotonvirus japonicus]|uniref:ORFan n=1 Tax=Cotonvirus japonicus TaxID=2811091 RepID=A0ABM7NQY4_9VIRU|nr:putative ORFan [Cotonvirus japonicus]BCS82560.1 putative ORFan [Cotonvirus japonicus]
MSLWKFIDFESILRIEEGSDLTALQNICKCMIFIYFINKLFKDILFNCIINMICFGMINVLNYPNLYGFLQT